MTIIWAAPRARSTNGLMLTAIHVHIHITFTFSSAEEIELAFERNLPSFNARLCFVLITLTSRVHIPKIRTFPRNLTQNSGLTEVLVLYMGGSNGQGGPGSAPQSPNQFFTNIILHRRVLFYKFKDVMVVRVIKSILAHLIT